jgi:hypothetical protein
VGGRDDLPALERAAADPEPLIAEHAVWAIGQIKARLQPRLANFDRKGSQLNPTNVAVASQWR